MEEFNHKPPLVSVLMCVYNGEDYLSESIQSVLDQTYSNFELIIADDASTDRTMEIIQSFQDTRIRFVTRSQRRHISYSLNEAIALARGDWIAHIDHDDIWERNFLEKQLLYLEKHPNIGASFCFANIIDASGSLANEQFPDTYNVFHTRYGTRKEWIRHFFYHGNTLCHSTSMVRRDLMPYTNLFLRQLQDFDMWCRIIAKAEIYVCPEELVRFRSFPDSGSASSPSADNIKRTINEYIMVIRRQLLDDLGPNLFISCFQEDFLCHDSHTPLELEIEKAFLLLHTAPVNSRATAAGLQMLEQILHIDGAVELLEDQYHFTLLDLYDLTKEDIFNTEYSALDQANLANARSQIESLTQEKERYMTHIQNLEQTIISMKNSNSWRITSPLRKIGTLVKKR